jgi:uncharacterized membrane protein YeaQ/YmgE (transglycosylase-associated protein family)
MGGILWIILVGFVAGLIARWLSPGPNTPSGFILTTVLGIAGASRPGLARRLAGIGLIRARGLSPRLSARCLCCLSGIGLSLRGSFPIPARGHGSRVLRIPSAGSSYGFAIGYSKAGV